MEQKSVYLILNHSRIRRYYVKISFVFFHCKICNTRQRFMCFIVLPKSTLLFYTFLLRSTIAVWQLLSFYQRNHVWFDAFEGDAVARSWDARQHRFNFVRRLSWSISVVSLCLEQGLTISYYILSSFTRYGSGLTIIIVFFCRGDYVWFGAFAGDAWDDGEFGEGQAAVAGTACVVRACT